MEFKVSTENQLNDLVVVKGDVIFTEDNIYLCLDSKRKVKYSGITPENFLKTRVVDTLPTTASENDVFVDITNKKIVIFKNGVFEDLSSNTGGGNGGDTIINLNGNEYVAGDNITITDGANGTKVISANNATFTGLRIFRGIPTPAELQTIPDDQLIFIV